MENAVKKSLRIAISIWSFTPNTGGLQSHAQLLCRYLKRCGHQVTVVTRIATRVPKGGEYLFFNERETPITVDGTRVFPLSISRKWDPVLWIILKLAARKPTRSLAGRLYEIAFAEPAENAFSGYDLVHHIGHATALMGLASARAAKRHRVPFLVQPTAHPFNFGDAPIDFRLYRQADRMLVHTRYERDYFCSKGIACPIDVVGNGIEDRSDGQGDRFRVHYGIQGPMILYLGRKAADKGYPLVTDAFRLLRDKNVKATLVCMGPTDVQTSLEAIPGVLELSFVSEQMKHDALAACTYLCVPSAGESFGLVYMEAGRYRKPVIGRNVPVLRELLGTTGGMLLGQPDDAHNSAKLSPEILAAGMAELLENPELCRKLGNECYRRSQYFLWPHIVKGFEASYYRSVSEPISRLPAESLFTR